MTTRRTTPHDRPRKTSTPAHQAPGREPPGTARRADLRRIGTPATAGGMTPRHPATTPDRPPQQRNRPPATSTTSNSPHRPAPATADTTPHQHQRRPQSRTTNLRASKPALRPQQPWHIHRSTGRSAGRSTGRFATVRPTYMKSRSRAHGSVTLRERAGLRKRCYRSVRVCRITGRRPNCHPMPLQTVTARPTVGWGLAVNPAGRFRRLLVPVSWLPVPGTAFAVTRRAPAPRLWRSASSRRSAPARTPRHAGAA